MRLRRPLRIFANAPGLDASATAVSMYIDLVPHIHDLYPIRVSKVAPVGELAKKIKNGGLLKE